MALSRLAVRRAAGLVVSRLDLRPPVDVAALLTARVDRLERVDWPQDDVDAILTGLGIDGLELTVFIRESDNLQRERFTMAHELGHLLLPWHVPSPVCSVLEQDAEIEGGEREADLFASCILVPDRWLAGLIGGGEIDMRRLLEMLDQADVSTAAALQALRRYLLPGWVFVAYGGRSVVSSPGTNFERAAGEPAQLAVLRRDCSESGHSQLNGHTVHWFRLASTVSLPMMQTGDDRSSHRILLDAISLAGFSNDEATRVAQSANGKVGGTLNEAAGRPAAETYAAMEHKLLNWQYSALLNQPDFHLWLAGKARVIESRGR